MAQLEYSITGNNSSLLSSVNNSISSIESLTNAVNNANVSLQFKNGIAALDTLGQRLLVAQGNATLFGDSISLQSQKISAYQTAINSLLANGYDPMDGDVQRLKTHIDELNASISATPKATISIPGDQTPKDSLYNPNLIGAVPSNTGHVADLSAKLAAGTITAQEYAQALAGANSATGLLGQTTLQTSEQIQATDGYVNGLKQALADLNAQRLIAPEQDLAALNAEIQQVEISLQQAKNVGKAGFDELGNSIRGVSLQNINGQLVALSNNLFGARQIARDTIRSFDSTSLAGFIKNISLLATDFLFYAQSAGTATVSTVRATTAIAAEGVVAGSSALSIEALGAALGSLINPAFLVVLGIGLIGEALEAQDKNQKEATKSAKELAETQQKTEDEANGRSGFVKSAEDLSILSEKINLAKNGFLDKNIVLKEYNDTLGQTIGKVNSLNEAEQKIVDNGPDYLQFLILKAQAQNAITKAADDSYKAAVTQNKINQAPAKASNPAQQALYNSLAGVEKSILSKQLDQDNADIKNSTKVAQDAIKTLEDFAKSHHFNIYPDEQHNADVSNLKDLQQQLDILLQKNSQLTGVGSGLTGYPKQVDEITKSYIQLNNQAEKYIQNVRDSITNGSISKSQGTALISQAQGVVNGIPGNEDRALSEAKIQDAQNTANSIQKINDDFGIKQQSGYNQELARTKKLYDDIVRANQDKANSLDKIESDYQAAQNAAGGNKLALDAAKKVYEAKIQDAKDAADKIAAAQADLLPAIQAIDEKYIQQEQQTYDKIIDIANQALTELDDGEESRTDKINTGWQKRIASANAYFDKLRDLAVASKLPQSAVDNINSVQSQINGVLNAANFKQVSEEISKNFAEAMQSAVQGFVSNFYTSITSLGETRQNIDEKYAQQLANAQDQATRDQITRIRELEKQSTASFGAIFSDLVSKFQSSFNQSILQSFTKQFTENLGKTLLTPTADQLKISPEEQSAERVSTILKSAGSSLADQIRQAGLDFYNLSKNGLLSGASGGSSLIPGLTADLSPFTSTSGIKNIDTSGDNFGRTVTDSGSLFGDSIKTSASTTTGAATEAAKTTTGAADHLSSKIAGAAAALSLAGGLVSGATSPTSKVGQGVGGLLQGAGEGALVGSAFGPEGAVIGAIGGAIIGGISGLFGASKAQKELQAQQLAEQQQQTALLKASLAYTSQIIGRDTANGIVTGISVGAFGQLRATVSGKDLQFVLDRNQNGR